ncbi:MAG: class I SAM-dependent methyltransferase [Flavobacteriia bacterium]|nr:class I SAM-dependent methyltransferase [Flavobacteriia bacterium]
MENKEKCPICLVDKITTKFSVKDFMLTNETFSIDCCNSCHFHFTNPTPNEYELYKYYKSDEYISHSVTKKNIVYRIYHIVRKMTLKRKVCLIQKLTNDKNILDYGAGTGHFLNECKKKAFNVCGIEPDEEAKKFALNNFNLELSSPNDIFNFSNESFDVITMWHVLEHVYSLDKTIVELIRILKENGIWIVAVPNMNSFDAQYYQNFWAAYDVPRHLYHFQQKDMINIAKKHGLHLIKTLPMKWDSYYVSLLSEKYRKGNKLNAFKIGFLSNWKAKKSKEYSSLIYVFKKEK